MLMPVVTPILSKEKFAPALSVLISDLVNLAVN